ncbi:C4-dicarboxylate transporter/malic acid transporter [Colletotrichum phormii]|uniref:C4-dicarboxylate transporter/malic acid transporter n=1 Tax=Colletotrichum phormii TaxID=359342 RepID=A0AAI9ZVI3_9PEZI|nr:C4-dicarboxylate transporter/malic acid transporter [Colletotrichum phormii]KAK1637619.1 C4-dicarboxylate transporter/malic acid transporter [Colletotrichum phormii]
MDRRDPQHSAWTESEMSTRKNSAEWQTSRPNSPKLAPLDLGFVDEKKGKENEKDGYNTSITPVVEKGTTPHGAAHGHLRDVPGLGMIDINDPNRPRMGWKARIHHFTWAWYTLTMSTGGLALLIFAQPHQFPGLRQIGTVVYVINIILFVLVCSAMLTRFFLYPGDMKKSLTHEREGFFFPTFFLSIATLITSTNRYAIPENDETLVWAIQVAFWGYLIVTLMLAIGQYSFVFARHNFGLQTMMPTWILPIFPIMLTGTIASVIADTQPEIAAVPIVIAGLTCQGLGLSVAVLMYAHMVGRLMSAGLPHREHRPGLFMNVGPPAFTALALIGMANGLPNNLDPDRDGIIIDAGIIRTIALMSAIFLWALAAWWFGIATIAVISSPPVYFHLGWWAMVFPNTGFTLATITIANQLGNEAVKWFATGMSVCLLGAYCFVLYHHIRAVVIQDIMYTMRDEDYNDH